MNLQLIDATDNEIGELKGKVEEKLAQQAKALQLQQRLELLKSRINFLTIETQKQKEILEKGKN